MPRGRVGIAAVDGIGLSLTDLVTIEKRRRGQMPTRQEAAHAKVLWEACAWCGRAVSRRLMWLEGRG